MAPGRGFATSPFGGGGSFQGEMSPEDLFNMFFGGGMGGGPFGDGGLGGGPSMSLLNKSYTCFVLINKFMWSVFTASFGPGGFRTTRVRANRGAGQTNAVPDTPRSMLISLLPLLILFGFSLLSALPNLFAEPSVPDPRFSFAPDRRYNTERQTSGLKIKYHVNNVEFSQHPQIAAELAAQASGNQRGTGVLRRFEGHVERIYTQELYGQCQRGVERKAQRKNAEIGLLGIGTDWNRVNEIQQETVESCEELKRLGVLK